MNVPSDVSFLLNASVHTNTNKYPNLNKASLIISHTVVELTTVSLSSSSDQVADLSCFIFSGDQFGFGFSNPLEDGLPEGAPFVQIFDLIFEYLLQGWKKIRVTLSTEKTELCYQFWVSLLQGS